MTTTPTAPAASALATLSEKKQSPRSISAMVPLRSGSTSPSQALLPVSTIGAFSPPCVGRGPKLAPEARNSEPPSMVKPNGSGREETSPEPSAYAKPVSSLIAMLWAEPISV